MFDVGFSELLVIAVVALLVLGPERLPKAARFAGLWIRRARGQWNSVKSEFERDLADDELKRSLLETRESLRDAHSSVRQAGSRLRRDFEGASEDLMRGPPLAAPAEPGSTSLPEPGPDADWDPNWEPPLESTLSDFSDPSDELDAEDPGWTTPDDTPVAPSLPRIDDVPPER
jgi:sec-independent protein translocase protein TatB